MQDTGPHLLATVKSFQSRRNKEHICLASFINIHSMNQINRGNIISGKVYFYRPTTCQEWPTLLCVTEYSCMIHCHTTQL
jgi:hypothetical protein